MTLDISTAALRARAEQAQQHARKLGQPLGQGFMDGYAEALLSIIDDLGDRDLVVFFGYAPS